MKYKNQRGNSESLPLCSIIYVKYNLFKMRTVNMNIFATIRLLQITLGCDQYSENSFMIRCLNVYNDFISTYVTND